MNINPDERAEKAMKLFREGYNCCQAVVLAFDDIVNGHTGAGPEQLAALCSGFGGGFARLREVCGSVSGMTMVAGAVCPAEPAPAGDAAALDSRKKNYALVQRLAEAFRNENGAIVCRELLGLRAGVKEAPTPSVRTPEFYKTRPCERLIGSAARILAEELLACTCQTPDRGVS